MQLLRLLKNIGLLRFLFLFGVFGIVLYVIYGMMIIENNTELFAIASFLLVMIVHISRKDLIFLKKNIKIIYPILLIEYFFILLPFYLIWGITGNLPGLGYILATNLLIPFLSFGVSISGMSNIFRLIINPFDSNIKSKLNIKIPFVKPIDFEWISGTRKIFIPLLFIYTLVLAFSFKPMVAPVGILVITVLLTGFYSFGESREMILIFAGSPKKFIQKKIMANFKYMSILYFPMAMLALTFQLSTWFYVLGAFAISLFIQYIAIIIKYALFHENSNLNKNGMILYINIFSILFPIFILFPIITGIRYYFKAIEKLNQYYDKD